MDLDKLKDRLSKYGHMHVFLDSGKELGVMDHDTEVSDGELVIDSKHGCWTIPCSKVEYVEKEYTDFVDGDD